MVEQGRAIAAVDRLRFFSEDQLARPGFPFSRLSDDTRIGWLPAPSFFDGTEYWVPAQQALVGYMHGEDEPQYMAGVTTGTAAHTSLGEATRNALLEVVQIDAAVGHWYGGDEATLLGSDSRTRFIDDLIRRHLEPGGPRPRLFLLPSADLPGFAVACVLESDQVPRAAVGLGCDLKLTRAMYKAFLESAAVAQLAKVILFRQATAGLTPGDADPNGIYDLDTNVGYCAVHPDTPAFLRKFGSREPTAPNELPPDLGGALDEDVRILVDGFRKSDKRLVLLDLTTDDIRALGFKVVRVWSPDVLSLPLPSAPPVEHPRFSAYGGIRNEAPHPFP
jgi:thiazole/oxazole-forming peptide maturase SagD family component